MNHSEQLNEIAGALAKAQAKIKSAIKSNTNPHFRSKYADLASVKDACSDALSGNDIAVVQAHGFEGDRFVLTTRLIHKSGQWLESVYLIKPVKEDPQGYASATTYARRIALSSMVGVVADEDDDGNAASNHRQETSVSAPVLLPKPADKGKAAETYVYSAIKAIGAMTNPHDIDAWYAAEAEKIAKLKLGYPDQYRELMAGMTAQRAAVSKVAAE